MNDTPKTELTNETGGRSHREIDPNTGQQRAYVVLSQEEREKGFIEPVRRSYIHRGKRAPKNLRALTEEEVERFSGFGYVGYESYDDPNSSLTGKYWTQEELDRVGKGCGTVTTLSLSIAETYARDPTFYSGTFCCFCKKHYSLDEFVWDNTNQIVGTSSK